jgi:hypothetical protein
MGVPADGGVPPTPIPSPRGGGEVPEADRWGAWMAGTACGRPGLPGAPGASPPPRGEGMGEGGGAGGRGGDQGKTVMISASGFLRLATAGTVASAAG